MDNFKNTFSIDELINVLNALESMNEDDGDTATNEDSIADKNKEDFYKEFCTEGILKRFAGACSAIMFISTVTNIPLDDVFDMFVDEMDRELHEKDTEIIMNIGRSINDIVDKLAKKED